MAIRDTSMHRNLSSNSSALTEIEDTQQSNAGQGSSSVDNHSHVISNEDEGNKLSMDVDDSEANEKSEALKVEKAAYLSRADARAVFLQPSPSYRTSSPNSSLSFPYIIYPIYSIPQSAVQTNALALPPCASHLFTGGSDGYIRRYSWYPSLRRQGAGERSPVLKGYWENPSISTMEALAVGDITKARYGPASITGTLAAAVAVHSLAIHKQELFALAGSAEGVINLFGVRIDEGQIRASLGMNGQGHSRGKPVSALTLTHDEDGLFSGGWDANVLASLTPALSC